MIRKKVAPRAAGALLVCCAVLASCMLDPEAVEIWGGDVTVPELVSLTAESETTLLTRFSATVTVRDASVTVPGDGRLFEATWSEGPGENSIVFTVSGTPGIGVKAMLTGCVSDEKGDTLSFSVPYTGYNNRVPRLRLNEIRTGYANPKVEYIELYVLGAGNLGGVVLVNARNEDRPSYEFPPAEVAAGEYVVYHLRMVEDGLVDETGALDASAGKDSNLQARDFWDNLTRSPLKSDNVILLRERKGGPLMDAVLLASASLTDWPTDTLKQAAAEAFAAGEWLPGSLVTDSVCSDGTSPTKTIGRNELSADTNTSSDWAICGKSECTPGFVNVPH